MKPSVGDWILRALAALPAVVCLLFAFGISLGSSTLFLPPQTPPEGWLDWHLPFAVLVDCGQIAIFTLIAAWMSRYVVTGRLLARQSYG